MATKSSTNSTSRASTKKSGCDGCGCGSKKRVNKTAESGTEMCSKSRTSRTNSSAGKSSTKTSAKSSKSTKSSSR